MTGCVYETLAERARRRARQHLKRARRAFAEGVPEVAYDRMRKAARQVRWARDWEAMQLPPGPERDFVDAVASQMADAAVFGVGVVDWRAHFAAAKPDFWDWEWTSRVVPPGSVKVVIGSGPGARSIWRMINSGGKTETNDA